MKLMWEKSRVIWILLWVCAIQGDQCDWASNPNSPVAVKSSEYVEIIKPENNGILNNQTAFI